MLTVDKLELYLTPATDLEDARRRARDAVRQTADQVAAAWSAGTAVVFVAVLTNFAGAGLLGPDDVGELVGYLNARLAAAVDDDAPPPGAAVH